MKFEVKREHLTLMNEQSGHEESWDYLTVYDKKTGDVLKRSKAHHSEGTIRLEYDGLEFVANRLGGHTHEITITLDSIIKKFS